MIGGEVAQFHRSLDNTSQDSESRSHQDNHGHDRYQDSSRGAKAVHRLRGENWDICQIVIENMIGGSSEPFEGTIRWDLGDLVVIASDFVPKFETPLPQCLAVRRCHPICLRHGRLLVTELAVVVIIESLPLW